jgi:DNA segregation ATPase FtsK/SpoIIIE, S-DNA-T family
MTKRDKKKKTRNAYKRGGDGDNENTTRYIGQESTLKDGTWKSVWGISLFVVSVFFFLASFGMGGMIGQKIYDWLDIVLGYGYFLIPIILMLLSLSFFGDRERTFPLSKAIGALLFTASGLALFHIVSPDSGGVIGAFIANPLLTLFDYIVTSIGLVALIVISLLIIYDASLRREHILFWKLFHKKTADEAGEDIKDNALGLTKAESDKFDSVEKTLVNKAGTKGQDISDKKTSGADTSVGTGDGIAGKNSSGSSGSASSTSTTSKKDSDEDVIPFSKKATLVGSIFVPPPLDLLDVHKGKPSVGDIKANANVIKRTLQNFGIDVEMDEVSIGPSVTRYALKPAEGVKLSKILGLQNNLALALAAHPIRIEAPIPGKSLVGIELPNTVKAKVGLGSLLSQEEYQKSDKPLMVALGKGISGKSHFANLAKMPHLLIAGATGSGKSVTIHTIISSLLFRNGSENLRFIMIDPKRVELTLYNKIPHLLTPVITDAKKAILALKWAAKEMDRRYNILEKFTVRDIDSYHKNIVMPAIDRQKKGTASKADSEVDPMPYIVVIIDELADIMQTYPRELESGIVRLAQMSRAVGIHLILSTQRPSVNVITGLIKANVPARIALQVASQIDSRTILDMRGAEELLGHGDMLFLSGEMSAPQRIQSAFISEGEIKSLVKYLVDNMSGLPSEITITGESVTSGNPDPIFSSLTGSSGEDDDVDDDLYEEAKQIVIEAGKASTSYIQRKLRVGYARAARLMDILESKGVIGPSDGAKPREVLVGKNQSGHAGSVDQTDSVMNTDIDTNEGQDMDISDEDDTDTDDTNDIPDTEEDDEDDTDSDDASSDTDDEDDETDVDIPDQSSRGGQFRNL